MVRRVNLIMEKSGTFDTGRRAGSGVRTPHTAITDYSSSGTTTTTPMILTNYLLHNSYISNLSPLIIFIQDIHNFSGRPLKIRSMPSRRLTYSVVNKNKK
jgi:hypothetical protein